MKRSPIECQIRKLDHPPAGPNFARFIQEDPRRSAKAIISFAKAQPLFAYQPAYAGIKDSIELNIDRETALSVARLRGAPAGRDSNTSLVNAFLDYDSKSNYPSLLQIHCTQ